MLRLNWTMTLPGGNKVPIVPPVSVCDVLIDEGLIKNPLAAMNEDDCQWVYDKTWDFEASFSLDAIPEHEIQVLLTGVDTLATLCLNGSNIGQIDNMFRQWTFVLPRNLLSKNNTLTLSFPPLRPHLEALQRRDLFQAVGDGTFRVPHGAWARKAAFTFGWDWGPKLPAPAFWGEIRLEETHRPRLGHISIRQAHTEGGVCLHVKSSVNDVSSFVLNYSLTLGGDAVVSETVSNKEEARLLVEQPDLWFPHGHGSQSLYTLTVQLRSEDGEVLDSQCRRIGLRRIRLVRAPDAHGESFGFEVNGRPIFAKGANWIPMDNSPRGMTKDRFENLLQSAIAANMNMLRVWGGGIYEREEFYDLCDEKGLLVWQDMMFACAPYPVDHKDFCENALVEVSENVRTLHHHACLALWCGNNEIEMWWIADAKTAEKMTWASYQPFFDRKLRSIVEEHNPEVPYWPGSPHTPLGNRFDFNHPGSGDAHIWDVWFNRQPFTFYRSCHHRFVSEFGFQSLPHPTTLEEFIPDSSRNIASRVMEHHQRSHIGNSAMIAALLEWFQLPTRWDKVALATQIVQGLANKHAVEHWRRSTPHCMGALYWQLNDCWPAPSWSSIDYRLVWKASHYEAARFFAPILVSLVEASDRRSGQIWITNDSSQDWEGTLHLAVFHFQGKLLWHSNTKVSCGSMASFSPTDFSLESLMPEHCMDSIFVTATLRDLQGGDVSSAWHTGLPPKHMSFAPPDIKIDLTNLEHGGEITLVSKTPQMFVWMNEGSWNDAFFHLAPNEPKRLRLKGDNLCSPDSLSVLTHLWLSESTT